MYHFLPVFDIWKHILRWLRLFQASPDRSVQIRYVKAHDGEEGNERADRLAKFGAELMEREWGEIGRGEAEGDYWANRKSTTD